MNVCAGCGIEFKGRTKKIQYHSAECRSRHHNRVRSVMDAKSDVELHGIDPNGWLSKSWAQAQEGG